MFFQLHRDLDREGPGSPESTRRALSIISSLPAEAQVLDIGCGPGQQTAELARLLPRATITAIDTHQPFLEQLKARAPGVRALNHDMRDMPFEESSFDLIWSEGAAYFMGSLQAALEGWKRFLRPDGWVAISEAVWIKENPPAPVRSFWTEYPSMLDVEGCRKVVEESGYRLQGDFVLPDEDWWEYYGPLETRLVELEKKFPDNEVLRENRKEIDIRREYGRWYSYLFIVAQAV